ncbi:MAG: cytochrome c3 family protein [Pyrinomonadaceae bacterium]
MLTEIFKSPFITRAGVVQPQPVPFSHKHHVADDGIDCRYCHTTVEKSAYAGMPPTETCMNCHSQLWTTSGVLEPVRASFRTGEPIHWTRVNNLQRFVYFNHSIHVAKGVGCATCHGRVDEMALTYQAAPLTMEWCLACHREPQNFIRPREEIFNMEWQTPANQAESGAKLVEKYHVKDAQSLTNCSTCHR